MPSANQTKALNLDEDIDGAAFEEDDDFGNEVVELSKVTNVVPKGEYFLVNESCELRRSNTGNPKFAFRIAIQGGQHDGKSIFIDAAWAEKAKVRSKRLFVGMGLPADFGDDPKNPKTLRDMAAAMQDLEYYGVLDIEQSEGINEATQQPYDPRNRLVSTSQSPRLHD